MPVLQYECKKCNLSFDRLVKKFDDPVYCPSCQGQAVRSYHGDVVSATGKPVKKCSGNCKTCGGCR